MLFEKALTRATPGTGSTVTFSGIWVNDLKSTVAFQQTNDVLTGTYESTVSSTGMTTTGSVQGYVDGDLISFIVHWKDFQAITAGLVNLSLVRVH